MDIRKFYICKMQASVEKLRGTINDILKYFEDVFGHLSEEAHFEMKVVLNELLVNAVKHGSKGDEEKFVSILAGVDNNERAILVVEDEGDGYDTTLIKRYDDMCRLGFEDAEFTGNVEDVDESGRGIFIVKALCDDFKVNQKGNKVVVSKKLTRIDTNPI